MQANLFTGAGNTGCNDDSDCNDSRDRRADYDDNDDDDEIMMVALVIVCDYNDTVIANVVAFEECSFLSQLWYIVCLKCSQRVLYSYRKEDNDGDGEPDPQPIPGSFSGRVPQIVELVTVSSNRVGVLSSHSLYIR